MNSKLLFLLILLLPTQFGKHFFLPFSFLSGVRIDYLAPTIYLTDILVLLLIIINFKTVIDFFRNKTLLIFLFLLIINAVFSLSPYVSMIRIIKWIAWFSLFAVIKKNFTHYKKQWFLPIFIGGLFELILVIMQLVNKHSIQGIFYFFGERYFTLSTPGVAKAVLQGTEFLRPYGTFSHPNSLAGFYLLIYFFVLTNKTLKNIFLKYSLLFVSVLLVFLSFSKVAICTLLILNTYYLILNTKKCKICFWAKIITLTAVGVIFISAQTDPLSLEKRLTLIKDAWRILTDRPIFGVGLGSYLIAQNQFPIKYSYFFLQPVHNIFLLFLSETGIIITGTILWLMVKWLKNKKTKHFLVSSFLILTSIFITGFFDHYWLTLQQNFLLLAIIFASIQSRG